MNTQQSVFTEIMEGLTLLFIAAILLGFILVASKVVYLLMIEYKEKRKTKEAIDYEHEAIDYEKEAINLISKLTGHPYVNNLDVTQSDDEFWDYYYHIDGYYKENYFLIYMNKSKSTNRETCITKHVTESPEQFKTFLETLTPLKFELS